MKNFEPESTWELGWLWASPKAPSLTTLMNVIELATVQFAESLAILMQPTVLGDVGPPNGRICKVKVGRRTGSVVE